MLTSGGFPRNVKSKHARYAYVVADMKSKTRIKPINPRRD